jgi:anti-sigma regulatory factor (Ser/Thr protein kinase)
MKIFVALPHTVGDARRFATGLLNEWGLSHLVETAELLISELITNALRHAGGIIDPPEDLTTIFGTVPAVLLSISLREVLVVEVWDQSTVPPRRRVAADDAIDGRGLELVETLSKEWGYEIRDDGKVIWFALDAGCA